LGNGPGLADDVDGDDGEERRMRMSMRRRRKMVALMKMSLVPRIS
jgi:hypothetical protein